MRQLWLRGLIWRALPQGLEVDEQLPLDEMHHQEKKMKVQGWCPSKEPWFDFRPVMYTERCSLHVNVD